MANYTIRSFVKEDIPAVVKIAKQSTFQTSVETLESWIKHDPDGILVAVSESGEVMGLCAAVNHNEHFSFGGTLIVLEEYRHLDIGHKLFAACFKHAGDRNIGLNCVSEKVNAYKRRGFAVFEDCWSTLEYECLTEIDIDPLSDDLPSGVEVRKFEEAHLEAMFAYDRALAGYDRRVILEASCKEPNTKTYVAFKDDVCVGFGSAKLNIFDAARVGPLYANQPSVAEVIFKRLLEELPDAKGVALVTISNNLAANGMMRKIGLSVNDNLLRLYTKERLTVNTSKIFVQYDIDFSPF